MKALIIGRFQPLHKGHLNLAKKIQEKGYKLIIGIGNNGNKRTEKYPFTSKEIENMWEPYREELNAEIHHIPDIPNDSDYAEHVEKITNCNEDETILVSGNKHTIECFTKYNRNYKILSPDDNILCDYPEISGTLIRKLIKTDEEWKHLVPEGTKKIIEKINGRAIIKKLC